MLRKARPSQTVRSVGCKVIVGMIALLLPVLEAILATMLDDHVAATALSLIVGILCLGMAAPTALMRE